MKNAESSATATNPTVALQAADVAPEKATSKKGATRKSTATRGRKAGNGAKTKTVSPKKEAKASKKPAKSRATTPRAESKGARILEMIGRTKGATLAEIMKVTDWQAHSVRGFLSIAAKKHGVKIDSSKNEAGDRVYRAAN